MKRFLPVLLVALLSGHAQAHDDYRQCLSRACGMCNRLHLVHAHNVTDRTLQATEDWDAFHDTQHAPPVFVPSDPAVVRAMVKVANLTKDQVVYDLGGGDGRILFEAVKQSGCGAVGIEMDPRIAAIAKKKIEQAGVKNAVIVVGDARHFKLDKADVIFVYLDTELLKELKDDLVQARSMVVSNSHPIPGVKNQKIMVDGKHPIYIWRRPLNYEWK